MKNQVETINLAPTPTGYARSLILIVRDGTNPESVKWAENEIINAFKSCASHNPEAWGKEE